MTRRFRVISTVALLGILGAILASWSASKSSQQEIIESLVEFVVKHGRMGMVTPEGLAYFQLPTGDVRVKHVTIPSDNGGSKSIQLHRNRDTGLYDIFFVHVLNASTAYFYLTSLRGELIKAAYLDPQPHPVNDAQARFESELEFWKQWRREKLKTTL
jgi:hypothetical protein